jgi:hypothetical protein
MAGSITALGGPIQGAVFAFKYRNGVYKLTPTGDVSAPYLPRKIADNVGCIAHKGCVVARDEVGNPALYFPAVEGPYRLVVVGGVTQLQYLGRDVEDIWSGINLAATPCSVTASTTRRCIRSGCGSRPGRAMTPT